jgi:hypothetical protein
MLFQPPITYLKSDGDSLLEPFRMTTYKSFVDLPAFLAEIQGEIRESTGC